MALYAEKTNNEWENRDSFKKFPNKFYPLDIDYGQVKNNTFIMPGLGSTEMEHVMSES